MILRPLNPPQGDLKDSNSPLPNLPLKQGGGARGGGGEFTSAKIPLQGI